MSKGRFGQFGGQYAPETMMAALEELEQALARIEAARIRQALNVSQALEADYLQLEQAACLAQPWNKKAIGQQFELPALELSLEVDAQIGRSYDAR